MVDGWPLPGPGLVVQYVNSSFRFLEYGTYCLFGVLYHPLNMQWVAGGGCVVRVRSARMFSRMTPAKKKKSARVRQSVGARPFGIDLCLGNEYGKMRQPRQQNNDSGNDNDAPAGVI